MIEVEGLVEAQAYLTKLKGKVSNDAIWQSPLAKAGREMVRYAASISPVVTGSYQGSHRATVDGKTVTMTIDPSARNTKTGKLVTRYAGPVEERHRVYARTGAQMTRIAITVLEDLARELGL